MKFNFSNFFSKATEDGGYAECVAWAIDLKKKYSDDEMIVDTTVMGQTIKQEVTVAVVKLMPEFYVAVEVYDWSKVPSNLKKVPSMGSACISTNLPSPFFKQLLGYVPNNLPLARNGAVTGPSTEIVKFFKGTVEGYFRYKVQIKDYLHADMSGSAFQLNPHVHDVPETEVRQEKMPKAPSKGKRGKSPNNKTIIVRHNITKDRFKKILVEPMCSDIPLFFEERKENEGEIVEREITLTYVAATDTVRIEAVRELEMNGEKYTQMRVYSFVETPGEKDCYEDDYVHIELENAKMKDHIVSEPHNANDDKEKVREFGRISAETMVDIWQERNQEDPVNYPVDGNGNPEAEPYCRWVEPMAWDLEPEELDDIVPGLNDIIDSMWFEDVKKLYNEGVRDYVKSHFGS